MALTIVGLGPGPIEQITPEARQALEGAAEVWVRGRRPAALASLLPSLRLHSLGRGRLGRGLAQESLARRLLARARGREVAYAVPGHPLEGEAVVAALLARSAKERHPRVVPGLSLSLAPGLATLPPQVQLVDALAPALDPSRPALVLNLPRDLSSLTDKLRQLYPSQHPAALLGPSGRKRPFALADLPRQAPRSAAYLYLPPAPAPTAAGAFAELDAIIARLRGPDGCPWDREQTHASLKPFLLEEAYEALEALDLGDAARLREELGDVLLQIMLHAQIAVEAGEFTIAQVIDGLTHKLIHRHPHVFGSERLDTAAAVSAHWDALKQEEKGDRGLLEGIPQALPALAYSQEVQGRAARAGFDWPDYQGILEKLAEEVGELRRAQSQREKVHELGDVLFALADAARGLGVDPEEALRLANRRFSRRFAHMEAACRRRRVSLGELSFDQQNALWDEAKAALNDR
ncbi:MAG: nucleoside triphosphate pyrophosphohydrolase [Chloroflexi bacterium]|nr:nucleoside triphosphate pyrophosphohydrolase [Chloroflexota bacterium]MBI4215823.1 nucleoside triphosphate pyrophosphohydrolase [Chloroflexota bacterium]